ncbi:MAG: anion transporter [Bacteroidales bacterium]|nr:anion transporter [Bacteroidales bacterium]
MPYVALIIFIITYIGIIFTRLPKINIDRPSAAFFGAVAMILFGILSFEEAILSIDFNTIALLLGMMIVIAALELDGFFELIAQKAIRYSKNQRRLLSIIVFSTGVSSAFFVNDTVVLLYTPIIIFICRASGLNPIPYLIAEILSANIGSAMTITGNPQNMLIGINSGMDYGRFFLHVLPVSVLGMIVTVKVVKLMYPKEFKNEVTVVSGDYEFQYKLSAMKFSVPIFIGMIILFFIGKVTGLHIPVVALAGAALIILFSKSKPSIIIRKVDWVLLLFFSCLFIVVNGFEKSGFMDALLYQEYSIEGISNITFIHAISLFASQIVSNVPFTILVLPVMKTINSEVLWISLASSATLAGNATIIGAMVNLIVIESAEKLHVKITFFDFLKTGIIVTFLSFIISIGIIYLQMVLGLFGS